MKITAIETIVGAIVIFIAVSFFYFAYTIPGVKNINGYSISATFNKVSGNFATCSYVYDVCIYDSSRNKGAFNIYPFWTFYFDFIA